MSVLNYNISSQLKDYLQKIDIIRDKILTTPIPREVEIRMRWEAQVERTYWSFSLADDSTTKPEVLDVLKEPEFAPLKGKEEIVNFYTALNFIRDNWLASNSRVKPSDIEKLYELTTKYQLGSKNKLSQKKEQEIKSFLNYIQQGENHPILQAGIAYIQIYKINPYPNATDKIAILSAHLFLYKLGYDLRDMLVFEEFFRRELASLRQSRESVETHKTLTLWLEFFTYALGVQANKILQNIEAKKYKTDLPNTFSKLNSRQKLIVSGLNNPGSRTTNGEVQKKYGVSQITASRDLAKLAKLRLVFRVGAGRSTYYTKGMIF